MKLDAAPDDADTVAHYSRPSSLIGILGNQHLRFGPVAYMADPRESTLDWIDLEGIGRNEHLPSARKARALKRAAGEYIRLICTAAPRERQPGLSIIEEANYGRPRMWAHYAENGAGFCVVLDQERLQSAACSRADYLLVGRVDYHPWLHMVSGGCTIQHGPDHPAPEEGRLLELLSDNEMLRSIYFKKSIDWKAEDEYRLLLYSERDGEELVPIKGVAKFVILGQRFPRDHIDVALRFCRELGCKCYQMIYQHPNYSVQELA